MVNGASNGVLPMDGTSAIGEQIDYTATYDCEGAQQRILILLIDDDDPANRTNSFYALYNRETNLVYLRNDANNLSMGGYAPGDARIIENSTGRLYVSGVSFADNGDSVTMTWGASFNIEFQKRVYVRAIEYGGYDTGFVDCGGWTVALPQPTPTVPPVPTVTPSAGGLYWWGLECLETYQDDCTCPTIINTVSQPTPVDDWTTVLDGELNLQAGQTVQLSGKIEYTQTNVFRQRISWGAIASVVHVVLVEAPDGTVTVLDGSLSGCNITNTSHYLVLPVIGVYQVQSNGIHRFTVKAYSATAQDGGCADIALARAKGRSSNYGPFSQMIAVVR